MSRFSQHKASRSYTGWRTLSFNRANYWQDVIYNWLYSQLSGCIRMQHVLEFIRGTILLGFFYLFFEFSRNNREWLELTLSRRAVCLKAWLWSSQICSFISRPRLAPHGSSLFTSAVSSDSAGDYSPRYLISRTEEWKHTHPFTLQSSGIKSREKGED